ncbi:MAG: protein adenylyltransferase SelO [Pseudomarimonas sp.]
MLTFDNAFIRELPGDLESDRRSRQRPGITWSAILPVPVAAPQLLAYSAELARRLDLTDAEVNAPWFAATFAGNNVQAGMQPWANNYGGHQFGHWAGQLGDGRAISLGEVVTAAGERWELQLKGAGPTPYSRGSDGRAVLRSSIREFLCSEAMFHLGVPTTRALSLVGTGDRVTRDMFYDGHPRAEPGAIVCRAAPSFIRFGTFELPASRGESELLQRLVDFCIARDFPHLVSAHADSEQRRAAWFAEVCERSAVMVAHWMRVGFVHGVMNTDNMSILGLTLDYGPYGWIDAYDPDWTPNTTDREHRRYRFGQQPSVVHWNLTRLAGAIAGLFDTQAPLHAGLQSYVDTFEREDRRHTGNKLGLLNCTDADLALMDTLRELLTRGEIDMTLFFRALAQLDTDDPQLAPFNDAFYDPARRSSVLADLQVWLRQYAARVREDNRSVEARQAQMNASNPCYVLRNYLAQQAIDAAEQGDLSVLQTLLEVMQRPYQEQPGREAMTTRRPEWARDRAGCSMLSCSS